MSDNTATAVRSTEWLGISARTKLALQKAAAGWGMEITAAQWTRIRKGGIMCGPVGGWAVEVRVCGGKFREWALGYTLGQLYDDMERAVVHCARLEDTHRAEMPSKQLSDSEQMHGQSKSP